MVNLDLHYVEPRLVALYDLENAARHDTDFYLALAKELGASKIIDLGCGTGVLTRELAAQGASQVWGVDPSSSMLNYAQRQAGAQAVRWVLGDSGVLGTLNADLATMTGNLAQVFLEDNQWQSTLFAPRWSTGF